MLKNFYSLIPRPLLDNSKVRGFFEKAKEYYDSLRTQILQIKNYRNPSLTRFPKELAIHENAFFLDSDSIENIRKAIEDSRTAVRQPTSFQTWKPVIDKIVGNDSKIWKGKILQVPFQLSKNYLSGGILGSNNILVNGNFQLGTNSLSNFKLGFYFSFGDSGNIIDQLYGNVYIDLGQAGTESQLEEIAKRLNHLKYTFYIVYIGYTSATTSGNFKLSESKLSENSLASEIYFIYQRRI